MKKNSLLFTAGFAVAYGLCTASVQAEALQLPNLTNANPAARFTVTGLVWAPNPGDASICLWGDDKLAAMSFTVDDNCYQNVDWWTATSLQHGFKLTWFLITDRITKEENSGFDGTWAQWQPVAAAGHELASHTAWHLHTELPEWTNIDDEYRISQLQIETNIPGYKCDFLAYPGGTNSYLNNRTNAATYYGAARGGASSGFNKPNTIDYFAVKNMGWPMGDPTTNAAFANPDSLFNAAAPNYYRSWAIYLNHLVNDYSLLTPMLNYIDANRSNLWFCTFSEGARYGQERDTATLTVTSNTAERIVMTLTDQMLDSRFNYPLTIKVRVNNSWPGVSATQAGTPVEAKLIENAGNKYALVKAVPDRGEILLASGTSADFTAAPTSGWVPLTVSFSDTSTIIGITNRLWDFGDGFTTNTTATNVAHTYTAAGTSTVQLIVSGATETGTNTQVNLIRVTVPVAPTADFTATSTSGTAPLAVTFTDTSNGSITNRFWSFGDGATTNTTATSVAHTYTIAGTNTAQLIVSGPVGASTNATTITVTVPVAPTANFTATPTSGTAPLAVTFTDTSIGSITNRFWSFGDGATTNTTATSIVHTYTSAGTNTVQLIVSGAVGANTNTQANLITVAAAPVPAGGAYFYDGFNYTADTRLTAASGTNGWAASTAVPTASNRVDSLTYSGITSTGGKVELGGWRVAGSPTTIKSLWSAAPGLNGTNLFASFLLNVASVGTCQSNHSAGNFVFQLRTGKSNVVISNNANNAANFNMGIQANGTQTILWDNNGGSGYTPNTTLFVVFSYTNSAADGTGPWGDQLWINPALAATSGTPNVSAIGVYTATASEGVSIGDGNGAGDPALRSVIYFDELRVGPTWASVVPAVISVPSTDADSDGIPNDWETKYFGDTTNANPNSMAANGVNTVMETYVADLNPTNSQSFFTVSNRLASSQVTLQWSAASGRVYSVYGTTNLFNDFQPLGTNILWPQNSWTDTVSGAQIKNFYQIKVQLSP